MEAVVPKEPKGLLFPKENPPVVLDGVVKLEEKVFVGAEKEEVPVPKVKGVVVEGDDEPKEKPPVVPVEKPVVPEVGCVDPKENPPVCPPNAVGVDVVPKVLVPKLGAVVVVDPKREVVVPKPPNPGLVVVLLPKENVLVVAGVVVVPNENPLLGCVLPKPGDVVVVEPKEKPDPVDVVVFPKAPVVVVGAATTDPGTNFL